MTGDSYEPQFLIDEVLDEEDEVAARAALTTLENIIAEDPRQASATLAKFSGVEAVVGALVETDNTDFQQRFLEILALVWTRKYDAYLGFDSRTEGIIRDRDRPRNEPNTRRHNRLSIFTGQMVIWANQPGSAT